MIVKENPDGKNIKERFKVISLPFFIPNFNLLSCKLGNLQCVISVVLCHFYIDIILKQNKYALLSRLFVENPK